MTEVPKVSPLAPAPSRGQARDDYSATADAFAASLPPMVDQINEVAEFVHEKAVAAAEAGSFAQAAQGYADDAQQSATAAEASSQSAIAAAAAAQASAGLPSLEGNDGKALVVSGGGVKWGDVNSLKRRPISAGYSLSADDNGSLIVFSGDQDAVLDFPPASALPAGWHCWVKNDSSADLLMGEEVIGPELIADSSFDTVLGDNIVVNGDFAGGSHWSTTGGWSISAGAATAVSASGELYANVDPLEVGKWYLVTFTVVSSSAGSVAVRLGNTQGIMRSTAGTYSQVLHCTVSSRLAIRGSGFSGSVDNLVVRPYSNWVLGGNFVRNPDFIGGSGWTSDNSGNFVFGEGFVDVIGQSSATLSHPEGFPNSTQFSVSFTVSGRTAGTLSVSINGGSAVGSVNGNGAYFFECSSGTNGAQGLQLSFGSYFHGRISDLVVSRSARVEAGSIVPTYSESEKAILFSNVGLVGWPGPIQSIPVLTKGEVYELSLSVSSYSSGSVFARLGGQALTNRSSNGHFVERFVASQSWRTIEIALGSDATTLKVDYVSLRKVSAAQTAPDQEKTTSSWAMFSGELRLFQCDGVSVASEVVNPFYKVFTQSSPFVKPPGYKKFGCMLWAGGQSGSVGNSTNTVGYGGWGSGCFEFSVDAGAVAEKSDIKVGSGGVYNRVGLSPALPPSASPGGDSDAFGVSVPGAAISGVPSGAAFRLRNGAGEVLSPQYPYAPVSSQMNGWAYVFSPAPPGYSTWGGASVYGAASGRGATSKKAISLFGGEGGEPGKDGKAPGGGGGGGIWGDYYPGNGARGEVRVWGVV